MRRNHDVLAEARRALEKDDINEAAELLYRALEKTRNPAARRQLQLELVSCSLLGGEEFLPFAAELLDSILNGPAADEPLLNACHAEIEALYGAGPELVRTILGPAAAYAGCAAGSFHAAAALLLSGAAGEALQLLQQAGARTVPAHFAWRIPSLEGVAHEQLGDYVSAAGAIRRAVRLAPPGDPQERERLALAECLLETGEPDAAASALARTSRERLSLPEDRVHFLWLRARTEEQAGNPGLAIGLYRQARTALEQLDDAAEGVPVDRYTVLAGEAQLQAEAGDWPEAVTLYREALAAAGPDRAGLARHELAVTLIDSGNTEEAAEHLNLLRDDDAYEWRAEVLAELADLAFFDGDNRLAEQLAREALDLREIPAACICLGCVALDYFGFADAVAWFEKAAAASQPGETAWVTAQQLLADTYARMGPETAERLLLHASAALQFTDRRNDWYLPLRAHEEYARSTLAGRPQRLVN